MVGALVAALLVATPLGAAAASSVGGTRTDIAALREQITSGADRIHQLTESYTHASLEAASLHQQLQTQYAQLTTLRRQLARSQSTLREAAVQSYTGQATTDVAPSEAEATDPAVGDEYLSVASGDVSNSIDIYQLRQRQVATAIRAISAAQKANGQYLDEAATARTSALDAAATEQRHLAALEAQLATAERRASAQSATQGLPVNGGIVKVTRTETSPATSPPSTSTTTPPTTPPPTTPPTSGGGSGGVWLELRTCESGDNYSENTGNGFYGAYQFSAQTWTGLGYPGRPDQEPPAMQDAAAARLQAASGWGQWPACAAALGLT